MRSQLSLLTWLFLLGVGPVRSTYLGCYVDYEGRQLAGNYLNSGDMTPKLCIEHCTKFGFKLAGLEVGSQCFCGDDLDEDSRVDDSQCGSPCGGDKQLKCGGPWRLAVHRTTVPGFNPAKGSYAGCYVDSPNRLLNGTPWNYSSSQTPQACAVLCRERGFGYSGTENSYECYCGDSLQGGTRVDDKECHIPCNGDTALRCGGYWRLSVYYTLVSGKKFNPVSENYKGCYNESVGGNLNGYRRVTKSLTPLLCHRLCRNNGFALAGLSRGIECKCGDWMVEQDKISDLNCKRPCAGDWSLVCGGESSISVYRTKAKGFNPSKGSYIGCYVDSPNRLLNGIPWNYSSSQTPQACADLCRRRGFKYSGTEDRWECYCGDSLKGGTIVDDKECNQPCNGDNSLRCGGAWRLSVYYALDFAEAISSYIGCYEDDSQSRILDGIQMESNGLTIESCVGFCYRRGFMFAGTESGVECYCGNSLKYRRLAASAKCQVPCLGNFNQICGASSVLSVYQTGITYAQIAEEAPSTYMGCYVDSKERQLFAAGRVSNAQNTQFCIGYCAREGYSMAGLEAGNECYCGDRLNKGSSAPETDCSSDCPRDSTSKCGGPWRLTVYSTPINGRRLKSYHLGCFAEEGATPLLDGASKGSTSMTVDYCFGFCYRNGFKLAGLKNGYKCQCGNSVQGRTAVANDQCGKQCTGDRWLKCGGEKTLTVYSTGAGGSNA